MNKKTIVISSIATVTVIVSVVAVLGSEAALVDRFPDLDPKLVRKAHRKMLRMAMTQDPQIVAQTMMDEDYDRILRNLVAEMQK